MAVEGAQSLTALHLGKSTRNGRLCDMETTGRLGNVQGVFQRYEDIEVPDFQMVADKFGAIRRHLGAQE